MRNAILVFIGSTVSVAYLLHKYFKSSPESSPESSPKSSHESSPKSSHDIGIQTINTDVDTCTHLDHNRILPSNNLYLDVLIPADVLVDNVLEIVQDENNADIDENCSLSDVIDKMLCLNKWVLPVYKIENENEKEYLGVVSLNDATLALLKQSYLVRTSMNDIIQPLYHISKYESIKDVMRHIIEKNVRYLEIKMSALDSRIIHIKDVIKYIHQKADSHAHIIYCLNRKLSEKIPSKIQSILSITLDEKVITAYQLMLSNDITSLPILENNKIISVISLSDIKIFAKTPLPYMEIMRLLHSDVMSFLEESRQFVSSRTDVPYRDVRKVITLNLSNTFKEAINLMIEENIQHIYIVDENSVVLDVISYGDIIRILLYTK